MVVPAAAEEGGGAVRRLAVLLLAVGSALLVGYLRWAVYYGRAGGSTGLWAYLPLVGLVPTAGGSMLLWLSKSKMLTFQAKFSGTLLLLTLMFSLTTLNRQAIQSWEVGPDIFTVAFAIWFAVCLDLRKDGS